MSIIGSKLLGCYSWWCWCRVLLVLIRTTETVRGKLQKFQEKDNISIFPDSNLCNGFPAHAGRSCVHREHIFMSENKVFVYKKVVYTYNFVQVIQDILFIRKNKGLWTAQFPREFIGLNKVVNLVTKEALLRCSVIMLLRVLHVGFQQIN